MASCAPCALHACRAPVSLQWSFVPLKHVRAIDVRPLSFSPWAALCYPGDWAGVTFVCRISAGGSARLMGFKWTLRKNAEHGVFFLCIWHASFMKQDGISMQWTSRYRYFLAICYYSILVLFGHMMSSKLKPDQYRDSSLCVMVVSFKWVSKTSKHQKPGIVAQI